MAQKPFSPSAVLEALKATIPKVLSEARQKDERLRPILLSDVAIVLAGAGFVDRALQIAGQLTEKFRPFALSSIAEKMAEAGLFDRALQVAESIPDSSSRVRLRVLFSVAEAMAEAGLFDRALQVAESIVEEDSRARAIASVAQAMAKAGDERAFAVFERAVQVAQKARDAMTLRFIVEAMAEARLFDHALQVTQAIADGHEKVMALLATAMEMAKTGDERAPALFDQALQVARQAKVPPITLCSLAEGLVEAGFLDRALQVAQEITEAHERFYALCAVAEAMAKAGDERATHLFDCAVQVAQADDEADPSTALSHAVEVMAKVGFLDRALQVARKITDERERYQALLSIAKELAKAGAEPSAIAVFDQALQIARTSKEVEDLQQEVAWGMAEVGLFNRAIQLARETCCPLTLRLIVEEMARQGELERAFELAQQIDDTLSRFHALVAIVEALRETGMIR
jgi:serine protease Do